ncbi:LuxR C-terminal-related transcriptional regulator [Bdellovibrio bacteriovorus]|uniref:LuxR C-terminal-related transcriptional regulator n=1 Tax=Bdellovibrio bacteriovorus TaxID=959 RepID=UPI003AA7DF89
MSLEKVLIIDDHPIVRAGLKTEVERLSDTFTVVGEAEEAVRALQMIQTENPSVVLLDHHLRGSSGFEVLEFIRKFNASIRVIVFTQSLESAILKTYWNSPVVAIVSKGSYLEDVPKALLALKKGERFLSDNIRQAIDKAGVEILTKREVEVARMIATGRSNKEIAEVLGCSDQTIKTHKTNIMTKLGVNTSVEVAMWVTKQGLS